MANDCDPWTVCIRDLFRRLPVLPPISSCIWMFDSRRNDSTNYSVAFFRTQMRSCWNMCTFSVAAKWMCLQRSGSSLRTYLKWNEKWFSFGFSSTVSRECLCLCGWMRETNSMMYEVNSICLLIDRFVNRNCSPKKFHLVFSKSRLIR